MSEPAKVTVGDRASKPEPLTVQYYKSRKQLALYSALLFAWEFIGIELPSDPFPNVDVHIKSPQAVPWVLIVLIFYFAYRVLVEWFQSDWERRELKVSRVDLHTSLAIPALALATFVVQRILDIHVADFLKDFTVVIISTSFAAGLVGCSLAFLVSIPYMKQHYKPHRQVDEPMSWVRQYFADFGRVRRLALGMLVFFLAVNGLIAVVAVPTLGVLVYGICFLASFGLGLAASLLQIRHDWCAPKTRD